MANAGTGMDLEPFEPPATTLTKGVGLHGAMLFAERELGKARVQAALEALEPEFGDYALHRLAASLVPLRAAAAAWVAVDALHPGDRKARHQFFREMGVFISDTNLHGIYKSILGLLGSPEMLVRRMPQLWTTYLRGVKVEVDSSQVRQGHAIAEVTGFGGAPHIAEMAEGWKKYALELVGGKDVRVVERTLAAGAPRPHHTMVFELSWSR